MQPLCHLLLPEMAFGKVFGLSLLLILINIVKSWMSGFVLLIIAVLGYITFNYIHSAAIWSRPFVKDIKKEFPPVEPLHDFDWSKTEPLKLRPFKPKFFLTMALETTNVSKLIQIDKNFFSRLALREEIIATHPNTSVRAHDAVKPAVNELYKFLVRTYLPTRFPAMFRLCTTSSTLVNLVSGALYPLSPSPSAAATLKTIGGLVDEDFMLLLPAPDGDGYSLQGYVVCFSSGFALDKIFGAKLRDIHEEVPRYREKLQASMEKWFERLQPGRYVCRANWTITMHGQLRNALGENQLYTDGCNNDLEIDDIDISKTHLRTELQHLYRLPCSGAVVFSYKTYLYPLTDIKAEGNGEALASAIEGLSLGNVPEIARYKRATVWGKSLSRWLRSEEG
ncbi:hypothetical protein K440DRAFT_663452 [Wilcoxina mikolae CBS 423.85]|nr:hypothetical protein K440DRAFT_663452 [Wilcoxina mikolae CBS 423.85]